MSDYYAEAITGLETELRLIDSELMALQALRPRVASTIDSLRELQRPIVSAASPLALNGRPLRDGFVEGVRDSRPETALDAQPLPPIEFSGAFISDGPSLRETVRAGALEAMTPRETVVEVSGAYKGDWATLKQAVSEQLSVTGQPPAPSSEILTAIPVDASDRRILRHLVKGTCRSGELREAVMDFVGNYQQRLKRLVDGGLVIGTGKTTNRRLALTPLGVRSLNAALAADEPQVVEAPIDPEHPDNPFTPDEPADDDPETVLDRELDDTGEDSPAGNDDSADEPAAEPEGNIFTRRDAAIKARLARGKATFVELLRVLPTEGLALHVDGAREVALRHSLRRLTAAHEIVDVGQHFQLRLSATGGR